MEEQGWLGLHTRTRIARIHIEKENALVVDNPNTRARARARARAPADTYARTHTYFFRYRRVHAGNRFVSTLHYQDPINNDNDNDIHTYLSSLFPPSPCPVLPHLLRGKLSNFVRITNGFVRMAKWEVTKGWTDFPASLSFLPIRIFPEIPFSPFSPFTLPSLSQPPALPLFPLFLLISSAVHPQPTIPIIPRTS